MSVSTNPLPESPRDQIIQNSLWLARVLEASQTPQPADIGQAMQLLRILLDGLQAEGFVLRTIERTLLPLVSGQSEYPLASDTIDVEVDNNGVAGMIVPSTGPGESPVMAMRANEWMQISNKSVDPARPTRVYVEKLSTVSCVFYPPPGIESASFRYRRVRLLRDVDTGSVTPDLPSRWNSALCWGLAALVATAKSQPIAHVQYCEGKFQEEKLKVRRDDVERGPVRLRLRYSGRNW